jgi:uncharacterized pyridoxal phosphate-containing UPF0001 family protein
MAQSIEMDRAAALADVETRIAEAAREAGRSADSVRLIAVSKTFEAPEIAPVLDAGHRRFGENRVQEAKAKWPQLRALYPVKQGEGGGRAFRCHSHHRPSQDRARSCR